MTKLKSILTLLALATAVGATTGCYTDTRHHDRRVYEPSGASRDGYYRDGRYYNSHDPSWSHRDERYNGRHQWDNDGYRR
ncbi:MAG: hypothetical protein ABIQ35_02025 [Verrucomicrobiota bacterium]